jgi:hypothetical protein
MHLWMLVGSLPSIVYRSSDHATPVNTHTPPPPHMADSRYSTHPRPPSSTRLTPMPTGTSPPSQTNVIGEKIASENHRKLARKFANSQMPEGDIAATAIKPTPPAGRKTKLSPAATPVLLPAPLKDTSSSVQELPARFQDTSRPVRRDSSQLHGSGSLEVSGFYCPLCLRGRPQPFCLLFGAV